MEPQQSALSHQLSLSVDEDAQNYAPEGELSGNIYRLLLKNVSRDDPLTREEAQELREFKVTLTEEQWRHWLHFAREEKHALKREARRNSPPKLRDLAKSPSKLLKALATSEVKELVEDGHQEEVKAQTEAPPAEPSQQLRRHEVSWSDNVRANLTSSKEHIADSYQDASSCGPATSTAWEAPSSAEDPIPDPAPAPAPAPRALRTAVPVSEDPVTLVSRHSAAEEIAQLQEQLREARQAHQPAQHDGRTNARPQQDTSHQQPRAAHSLQYHAQSQPQQQRQSADIAGVSLERNTVVGRTRSASAPRDRPSAPPTAWGQARTTPGPAYPQQQWLKPMTSHSPKHRDVESPFRGDQKQHHHHHHQSHQQHHQMPEDWSTSRHSSSHYAVPPPARSGSHLSRAAPVAQFATRQPAYVVPATLDLADAAEIARSTAFRLDSAYSAAQCLLSSMAADQVAPGHYGGPRQGLEDPPHRAETTISILAEMMSSMDKSRAALSQLSDLHSQQQQQGPQQRWQPAWSQPHPGVKGKHAARTAPETYEDTEAWRVRLEEGEESAVEERYPQVLIRTWGTTVEEAPLPRVGPASAQRVQQSHQNYAKPRSSVAQVERDDYCQDAADTSFLSSAERHPSEWRIPSEGEEEQSSILMSPGASLNARYAQNKAPGEFSPWNKQLATSAVAVAGAQIDPVSNLQSQLFEAADGARRATNQHSVTRAAVQSPAKHASQYSYSSAGYVWEGVRYNRAQGPVSRVCLSHGPLVKAFDDYPVRVDAETGAVDVVWREARVDAAASGAWGSTEKLGSRVQLRSKLNSSSGQLFDGGAARGSVLRRERFAFDDVFTGQTADGRLAMYSRQRTRKALEGARSLAFLCLGCGDVPSAGESAVEPPVSTLLGGGGGTGLISSVIDEIFRFTRPLTAGMQDSGKAFSGSFPTAAQSPFVASKVAFEQLKSKVTLSAIILSDRGIVFDLLSTAGAVQLNSADGSAGASLKRRKSDGRVVLCSASRLQLQNASDFDRVMGLLLGKRTALQGVLSTMQHQRTQQRAAGLAVSDESMQEILASIDPWAAFNSRSADRAVEGSSCASTMLIAVSVTGGLASSAQTTADFYFISPCGKNWFNPGADINILAELVTGLPATPPPSLLRASPLGLLLMDPRNPATDFVNIVTINRESSGAAARDPDGSAGAALVQGALNSLRVIAQLTQ